MFSIHQLRSSVHIVQGTSSFVGAGLGFAVTGDFVGFFVGSGVGSNVGSVENERKDGVIGELTCLNESGCRKISGQRLIKYTLDLPSVGAGVGD